jgi:hypothetical protein
MPNIIKINNKKYYNCVDIINEHKKLLVCCKKSNRDIIKKMKLKNKDYIFAYYNEKEKKWNIKDTSYKKAKVLILTDIVDAYLEKYDNDDNDSDYDSDYDTESSDDTEDEKIKPLPSILKLKKSEKFKDEKDEPIDIDIRGERKKNKCFFNAKDVQIGFDMKNLDTTIIKKNTNYLFNKHYVYFNSWTKSSEQKNKKINKKLYLTFDGLMKVLYSSNGNKTDKFKDWANNLIFTAKYGTDEEKYKMFANDMGIDIKTVELAFKKTTSTFTCVYLYYLGTVGELRQKYNISDEYDDDMLIFKFGQTNNIIKRSNEHKNDYGDSILLNYYSIIEKKFKNEAEDHIRKYVKKKNIKLHTNGKNELLIINRDSIKNIQKQYDIISTNYSGSTKCIGDLINNTKMEYENKLKDEKHKNELLSTQLNLIKQFYSIKDSKDDNKKTNDIYLQFMNKYTEESKGDYVRTNILYPEFTKWFLENNTKSTPPSNKVFVSGLRNHFTIKKKKMKVDGKKENAYLSVENRKIINNDDSDSSDNE